MCHGLCETGSTPLLDMLGELRGWMAAHPDEVVTLFVENHVAPDLIAADVERMLGDAAAERVHLKAALAAFERKGNVVRAGQVADRLRESAVRA